MNTPLCGTNLDDRLIIHSLNLLWFRYEGRDEVGEQDLSPLQAHSIECSKCFTEICRLLGTVSWPPPCLVWNEDYNNYL